MLEIRLSLEVFGLIIAGAVVFIALIGIFVSVLREDVLKCLRLLAVSLIVFLILLFQTTKDIKTICSDEYKFEQLVEQSKHADRELKLFLEEHPEFKEKL